MNEMTNSFAKSYFMGKDSAYGGSANEKNISIFVQNK